MCTQVNSLHSRKFLKETRKKEKWTRWWKKGMVKITKNALWQCTFFRNLCCFACLCFIFHLFVSFWYFAKSVLRIVIVTWLLVLAQKSVECHKVVNLILLQYIFLLRRFLFFSVKLGHCRMNAAHISVKYQAGGDYVEYNTK